jgi:2-hydroxy-6-oxonona-2,4-dienedioate hydrolase
MIARETTENAESRWASVRGMRVHARIWDRAAPAGAPGVVLVHGIGVASRDFVQLGARLAPHAPVYAVDLPGFGESDKPPRPPGLHRQSEMLAAWMDAVGLERATLLANSVGCQVAAHLAVRRPERIERLILIGPTFDPRARSMPGVLRRWLPNSRHDPLSLLPIQVRPARGVEGPNRGPTSPNPDADPCCLRRAR